MAASADGNRVTITVPARTDHLHLLRLNVAAIAGGAFGIDDVEDVKIAVEELAAALVAVASADSRLAVEVELRDGMLRVSGRRRMSDPQPVELAEFVPTILEALVDAFSYGTVGDEAGFTFEKQLSDG